MTKPRWEGTYTYGEGLTADGQMVKFTCRPEDLEKVTEALKLFRDIEQPTSKRVKLVGHGAYGMYTRFDITQHKYAGGHGGYIETLEIKDAPDGRCGSVLHDYNTSTGHAFYDFDGMESAIVAFEKFWSSRDIHENIKNSLGFKRYVYCGPRLPWFYAVGDQHIAGDIVFPDCIMEDPVYRFGRKFVVYKRDEGPRITECVGLHMERPYSSGCYDDKKPLRVVFFEDGTIWREGHGEPVPQPLRGDQLWIHEAIQKFENFLAGKASQFAIEFIDGSRFLGRLKRGPGKNSPGTYHVTVELDGGELVDQDFEYTPQLAKIWGGLREYMRGVATINLRKIKAIKSLRRVRRSGAWEGVFTPPEE